MIQSFRQYMQTIENAAVDRRRDGADLWPTFLRPGAPEQSFAQVAHYIVRDCRTAQAN